MLENRPLRRFVETIDFVIARYNRGRETMSYEVRPTGDARGRHEFDFWLNGRRDLAETGSLDGDLISFDQLTMFHLGSRQDLLHAIPRLGRILIEKEYGRT